MGWRRDSVARLISLYRKRPVLWDPNNPDYKDRIKKREAWTELANVFKMNVKAVETKMRGLIGQFQRELRKGTTSVYGGKTLFYSEWIFFKKLLFLREKTEAKFARTRARSPSPCDKDIAELQSINFSLLLGDFKPTVITKTSAPQTASCESETPSISATNKATCYLAETLSTTDLEVKKMKIDTTTVAKPSLHHIVSTSVGNEECEEIASLWISKLRKLDEVQRVLAENLITQVFTKAYFLQLTRNTQIGDGHSIKEEIEIIK